MKKNINIEDEKLKDLLSGTKLKASDNLKYRIMQQIETESALSKKVKVNKRESILGNFFSVYGIVYALIILLGGAFYLNGGKDSLLSPSFFGLVILLITVGSAFFIITLLDTRRLQKKGK